MFDIKPVFYGDSPEENPLFFVKILKIGLTCWYGARERESVSAKIKRSELEMSGGHFDYKDSSLVDFVTQIEDDLLNEHFEFSETRKLISLIIEETKKAGKLLHSYDWMMSGDTGEEFFIKEVKEILKN